MHDDDDKFVIFLKIYISLIRLESIPFITRVLKVFVQNTQYVLHMLN